MLSTYQLVKFYWSQKRSLIADDQVFSCLLNVYVISFFVLFQSSKQQQIAPVKLEQSQIKLLNDNMRYVVAIIEARVNFGDDSDEDVCLTFCVVVVVLFFFRFDFFLIFFFCRQLRFSRNCVVAVL